MVKRVFNLPKYLRYFGIFLYVIKERQDNELSICNFLGILKFKA
jgi:hypothetical protein